VNFEVDRTDLHHCRLVDAGSRALEPGEARLAVDAFALTTNNITYAVAGDMLRYWNFFPTDEPWGRIPVWGFADVVESRHDELPVGVRVYGYLPMGTELIVLPGRVDDGGFTDLAPHRSAMAAAYNRYARQPVDPSGGSHAEDQRMVLSPLFFTSFLIDDAIFEAIGEAIGEAAGGRVILSSASSKTALGTAFCLRRRSGVEVVGLTSRSNVEFVASLGLYHRVAAYDDDPTFESLPTVFVDIAGSAGVRHRIHEQLADDLAVSHDRGHHPLGCATRRHVAARSHPDDVLRPRPDRRPCPRVGAGGARCPARGALERVRGVVRRMAAVRAPPWRRRARARVPAAARQPCRPDGGVRALATVGPALSR
jgi:hypothetical protein